MHAVRRVLGRFRVRLGGARVSLWFKFGTTEPITEPRSFDLSVDLDVRCDEHAPVKKSAPLPKNNAWCDGLWRRLDNYHPDHRCYVCSGKKAQGEP